MVAVRSVIIACPDCGTLQELPQLRSQTAVYPTCENRLERTSGRSCTAALLFALASRRPAWLAAAYRFSLQLDGWAMPDVLLIGGRGLQPHRCQSSGRGRRRRDEVDSETEAQRSCEPSNTVELPEHLESLTAIEIASPEPIWVSPDCAICEVARLMRAEGIHRVLVGHDGRLAGILTAFDLLQAVSS